MNNEILLEVNNLYKSFPIKTGIFQKPKELKAVDDVSFKLYKGETLGLIGESGCGKSTLGRTILHMIPPTSGEIKYKGELINEETIKKYAGSMQMVFQDSYSSLDPCMTIGDIIAEPLWESEEYTTDEQCYERVFELLETVGLKKEHARRFPNALSGGQRQRVGIARALTLKPELIVCDEPVSALDVSIKAQIINTFGEISKSQNIAYLFITHDILTARYISDRMAVMYLGRIVEIGNTEEMLNNPRHPYTKVLFSAIALPSPRLMKTKKRIEIKGEIPSPINAPSGCSFRTRCPYARDICAEKRPVLETIKDNHLCACWLKDEIYE